jgi:hypothetical protein
MQDRAHHNMTFEVPTKLYQEVGFELRRIVFGLGVGSYYRIGAYQEPSFSKNVAFRLIFEPFY